jgi:hypothetical protein
MVRYALSLSVLITSFLAFTVHDTEKHGTVIPEVKPVD